MSIKTTISVVFSNYQVSGWIFNGSATESFDAVYTYELDIEGGVDGEATSTLQNALTDITINASVLTQGEQADTIELQAMKFNVAAYKDQDPFCEYESGTAFSGSDDITEELAEYFEDEML